MSPLLLVMLGAAVGAPVRFLTDRTIQSRHDSLFPWGTLVMNVVGSFILGAVVGRVTADVQLLVGAGFCGALTTYSTFSYETLRLADDGSAGFALLNVVTSVVAGVSAATLGVLTAGGWR